MPVQIQHGVDLSCAGRSRALEADLAVSIAGGSNPVRSGVDPELGSAASWPSATVVGGFQGGSMMARVPGVAAAVDMEGAGVSPQRKLDGLAAGWVPDNAVEVEGGGILGSCA